MAFAARGSPHLQAAIARPLARPSEWSEVGRGAGLLHAGSLPVFKPALQWCGANATPIVEALAAQPPGSLSYVYITLGSDTAIVDDVAAAAAQAAPQVRLVGYRELIALAQQKKLLDATTATKLHDPR